MRELKARPSGVNEWNEGWLEAHQLFAYETFLYLVAALIKTRNYGVLHEIFTAHYLLPKPTDRRRI